MTEAEIIERYTAMKPCVLADPDPEETDPHNVWLVVNQQSFCLDGHQDTKADAQWMRSQLAKAIETIIKENSI